MVDVPANLLAMHGAVSLEAASAMGLGAQRAALADFGIAVTGIAGPDGGTDAKPVGTVCFGWASPGSAVQVEQARFAGDRNSIRNQAIDYAIQRMLEIIEQGQ